MPIRLVFADDHLGIREALAQLLRRDPDLHIVARCQSGDETLHAVRQHRPDILILDPRISGKNGLEVLRAMRQEKLPTRVVLLTAPLYGDELLEAMLLGVGGVVLKEQASQQLLGCLRKVYAGNQWLDTGTVGGAVEALLRREVAACERALGLRHEGFIDPAQGLG